MTLDYCLVVSRVSERSNAALINAFIGNCIRLYKLSLLVELDLPPTDRRSGDDAAMMAAAACIHLYHRTKDCKALIRSALILEMLLTTSKHNYSALLLLVQLYLHMGCISMVVGHWRKLDVKNVQTATTVWMLLSRISTISPGEVRVPDGVFNPLVELLEALTYMNNNSKTTGQGTDEYFVQENYNGLVEHAEFVDKMTFSSARYVFFFEISRLDRFCYTDVAFVKSIIS